MLAIGKYARRTGIIRNNVAMAWVGEVIKHDHANSLLILKNPRPLHAGLCEGSSDLIGWTTVEITPDMVGKRIAVFTAAEVKTANGRASHEQANFIEAVRQAGGIAGIVRSEKDAIDLINE